MVDDARTAAGTSAYRGFLFSDMRGFTAFAERHGNSAAAAKVGRFLEIARRAIERFGGSEVTTEGDAIHAVFPSASSAVLCGLDIVEAAAELNAHEPERPLALGVGVHAGEAVQTAEGYIGRAVNIAARLCAAARPGEVLVSSTVKGITQSSITVGFVPRGRRRLKGIEDQILVYAVTRDPTATGPRTVPRPVLVGAAGAAAVAVLAIAAFAGSQLFTSPAPSPPASTGPVEQPIVIGPLPIGSYATQHFQPAMTFHIDDLDWNAYRDGPEILGLIRDDAPRGNVDFLRVQEVIANPCVEGGDGSSQTGPADLLTELAGLEHLVLSEPVPVRVGGQTGQQVEITVSDGVLAACGGLAGGQAAIFGAGDEVWKATAGERFRLVALDVDGQAVTILLSTDWTETPSVQELESLYQLGQRILDSVQFQRR